jgi:hypothetical protein
MEIKFELSSSEYKDLTGYCKLNNLNPDFLSLSVMAAKNSINTENKLESRWGNGRAKIENISIQEFISKLETEIKEKK